MFKRVGGEIRLPTFFVSEYYSLKFNITDNNEYRAMKEKLRAKDVVIVYEMDRLGRNKQMIKEELEWFKANDVRIMLLDIPTTMINLDSFDEGIAK